MKRNLNIFNLSSICVLLLSTLTWATPPDQTSDRTASSDTEAQQVELEATQLVESIMKGSRDYFDKSSQLPLYEDWAKLVRRLFTLPPLSEKLRERFETYVLRNLNSSNYAIRGRAMFAAIPLRNPSPEIVKKLNSISETDPEKWLRKRARAILEDFQIIAETGYKFLKRYSEYGSVRSLAFSPDGNSIAVGWGSGEVTILDANTGDRVLNFRANSENEPGKTSLIFKEPFSITHLKYSPNGHFIATTAVDKRRVKIWDTRNGTLIHNLDYDKSGEEAGLDPITSLHFSLDGTQFLTGGGYTAARVWDVGTGEEIHRNGPRDIVSAAFFRDGKRVVTVSSTYRNYDDRLSLWDLNTGHEIWSTAGRFDSTEPYTAHKPIQVELSTDEEEIYVVQENGDEIGRYSVTDGKTTGPKIRLTDKILHIKALQPGSISVVGSKSFETINLNSKNRILKISREGYLGSEKVAVSPVNLRRRVVAVGEDFFDMYFRGRPNDDRVRMQAFMTSQIARLGKDSETRCLTTQSGNGPMKKVMEFLVDPEEYTTVDCTKNPDQGMCSIQ